MPGHRPDVQDGAAGVSMEAGTAMEARVWLKAPVLAAWIYIYIYVHAQNRVYVWFCGWPGLEAQKSMKTLGKTQHPHTSMQFYQVFSYSL